MKFLVAFAFFMSLVLVGSRSWAQVGGSLTGLPDEAEDADIDTQAPPPSSFGMQQHRQVRRGKARLGEWICRDEPPPPGQVITRGGSMGSCVGTCASRYIERLRDHMVICAGQQIPHGYDLLGVTTVSDCECVSDTENALIIQLKHGYVIKRRGAVRNYQSLYSTNSADTENSPENEDNDLTGDNN